MGDGLEKGITLGPLANPRRLDAMESFVNDAKARGGKIADRRLAPGQPGLLLPADGDHRRARRFQDHDRGAVRPAGADRAVQDLRRSGRARQLAAIRARRLRLHLVGQDRAAIGDAIQSGMVGVNSVAVSTPETPFGGVKESGYGSEGGIEGLQAYMNTKFRPRPQLSLAPSRFAHWLPLVSPVLHDTQETFGSAICNHPLSATRSRLS